MSAFVKIEAGVVVQKQPYPQEGFVEVGEEVICGMVEDGSGGFVNPAAKAEPVEVDPADYPWLAKR